LVAALAEHDANAMEHPGQDIARPATQLLLGGPGQRQFVGVTTVPSYAMQLFFLVIVIVAVLSWPKGLAAARQL